MNSDSFLSSEFLWFLPQKKSKATRRNEIKICTDFSALSWKLENIKKTTDGRATRHRPWSYAVNQWSLMFFLKAECACLAGSVKTVKSWENCDVRPTTSRNPRNINYNNWRIEISIEAHDLKTFRSLLPLPRTSLVSISKQSNCTIKENLLGNESSQQWLH